MEILQNLGALPIYFLMFVVLYFFMIRPQVKQTKEHNNLISNLKKGDKVIMRDGICGKIVDLIGENKLLIESSPQTKITVLKTYVSRIDN